MKIAEICNTCHHRHDIDFNPKSAEGFARFRQERSDWMTKHAFHDVDFKWPQRSDKLDRIHDDWMNYLHNADVKITYAASADYTITLTSLASSATFVAGRESTAINNTSNKYLDYLVGGKITTGTTPTDAKSIRIYLYAAVNDTPLYPDVLDGTDSDETITSVDILNSAIRLAASTSTNNTSDRVYWFAAFSVASFFGGVNPIYHGLFVVHDTAVNLNATGSNQKLAQTGVYATVI